MIEAAAVEVGDLDKLAQLTRSESKLRKRARAKFLGLPLVLRLAELDSPLRESYWNSFHCSNLLEQFEGEITAKYCKCRWCIVCSRIRMAKAIRDYLPVIETWDDPHFVTLTVPNVWGGELAATLERMVKRTWIAAKESLKRRKIPFKGIRKIEITYNAAAETFHPHFHVIVEGAAAAAALKGAWLKRNPKAVSSAQDVRSCDERALTELFKYFSKLASDDRRVSPEKLDVIFRAMKGRRVFQSFGFVMPKVETTLEEEFELNQSTQAISQVERNVLWEWDQDLADWVDRQTGECLTGYEPSERDRSFVEATCRGEPLLDDRDPLGRSETRLEDSMSEENWKLLKESVQDALDVPKDQRRGFVRRLSLPPELEREVLELLSCDPGPYFLESPASLLVLTSSRLN